MVRASMEVVARQNVRTVVLEAHVVLDHRENMILEEPGWDDFVERHSYDDFWCRNQPAFHAYDLGANIEMPASDSLRASFKRPVSADRTLQIRMMTPCQLAPIRHPLISSPRRNRGRCAAVTLRWRPRGPADRARSEVHQ
ncbi:hypothetical protein V501_01224 [Pseudogymnoascus sp. VKM F-4519 (FW-2642)]|nr:hypothetical protein V501_01224 [Pseudogymnoascus sp. VKM F-4519 (FW-2642)]